MKRKVVWIFGTVFVSMFISTVGYSETMTQAMRDWDSQCVAGVVSDAYDAEYVYKPSYLVNEQSENTYWPSLNSVVASAKAAYLDYLTTLETSFESTYGSGWRTIVVDGHTLGYYYDTAHDNAYPNYGSEMTNFNSTTTSMILERQDVASDVIQTIMEMGTEATAFYIVPVGWQVMLATVAGTFFYNGVGTRRDWSQYTYWRGLRSQSLITLKNQFIWV